MTEPTPTILPTKGTEVLTAVLTGGVLAFLTFGGMVRFGASLPVLGPVAWVSVALLAAGIGALAFATHAAVQKRREPIDPKTAVTRLLLGKTSLLAGAFLGAAYAGLVAVALQGWPAPLAQERVVHGGIAALACASWAVAGWLLERSCRIPRGDTPEGDTREGDGPDEGRALP